MERPTNRRSLGATAAAAILGAAAAIGSPVQRGVRIVARPTSDFDRRVAWRRKQGIAREAGGPGGHAPGGPERSRPILTGSRHVTVDHLRAACGLPTVIMPAKFEWCRKRGWMRRLRG